MKRIILGGVFYLIILACELELATSISIPVTANAPIIHVYIDRGQLVGEVVSSRTDFDVSTVQGIPEVEVSVVDEDGNIQTFISDGNGQLSGVVQIAESLLYQLVSEYDGQTYRSNWISPLPDSIQTTVQSMSFDSDFLLMKLRTSLEKGAVSHGPITFFEGRKTDSTYFDGLGYRHFQVFDESTIESTITGISQNSDVDSVLLRVVYMDDEYRQFYESLYRNTSGMTNTSFESAYNNIESNHGLFCFVYRDTISYGL